MGKITNIIDAIRRKGSLSQKSALARQDEYLSDKTVSNRRVEIQGADETPTQVFMATVEAKPEEVRAFDEAELAAIHESADRISSLSARYLGVDLVEPNPEELDALFTAWAHSENRGMTSDEEIVQILGAAFGQHCCNLLNMSWVLVTDEYGSAAAVKGIAKDFRGFPFDSIRKRIVDSEHKFFVPVYVSLKQQSTV